MIKRFRDRYSVESLAHGEMDERGRLFMMPDAPVDLSSVRILHEGVDTVRQLYSGVPIASAVQQIAEVYTSGVNQLIEFAGEQWVVGSGGASGYRYRLQNNELGLIVLYGSRYVEMDKDGAHLKIECSPHYLLDQDPRWVQLRLNKLAEQLLQRPEATGVAIHIAIDVQGWQPPADFEQRLTTRSKRRLAVEGIDNIELIGGQVVQRYGDRQTFMFGSAGSVQFVAYRKDIEAYQRDKLDFWEDRWFRRCSEFGECDYLPGRPVWRLEFRFHHTVFNQIENPDGTNWKFTKYVLAAPYLTNVLRYGLSIFRLDWNRSWVDPFWQLLYQDVTVAGECDTFVVRRIYKTHGRGDERNLALILGNMITVYARYGYKTRDVIQGLQGARLWDEMRGYLIERGHDPQEYIDKALSLRRLIGKAA